MRLTQLLCILVPALSFAQATKVDLKVEEAAIRKLIANPTQIKFTEDAVQWTGARKRPSVGSKLGEPFSAENLAKRKNQVNHDDIQRIEIASSGDMAYEFSYGKLDYDVEGAPVQHVSFETGLVRVWKKAQGEWKVAAMFVRPLDAPFERLAAKAAK
jgi:ketosteroid isomerase-like protein